MGLSHALMFTAGAGRGLRQCFIQINTPTLRLFRSSATILHENPLVSVVPMYSLTVILKLTHRAFPNVQVLRQKYQGDLKALYRSEVFQM